MALAVVTRIPSFVEAQIAVGALRSGGIDAELFDGNFGQVESPVIESLGGFRVMAPEHQVAAARALLKDIRASPGLVAEPDEMGPWAASLAEASRARSKRMRLAWTIVFGLAAGAWLLAQLISWLAPPAALP